MTSTNGWRRSKFCDSGNCLEIQVDGQSVSLRETSTPDQVVVTSLASWETWRAEAKAEERAAIVAGLRGKGEHWESIGFIDLGPAAHLIAAKIERGEFDDLVAGDE